MKSGRTDIFKKTELSFAKIVLILSLALIPYFAYAGVFSLGFLIDDKSIEIPKEKELNSQSITLLQAAVNFDPNPAKGGGEITIVDNVALLAETGLTGSIVEIKEKEKNSRQISIYEVREGDTLSQIAQMFDVSVNTIRWANDFEGPISRGQTLIILPITGVKHIVKNGGTVADIAKIYEGDAREIALFNGISINQELKSGDEILVPNGALDEAPKKEAKKTSGPSGSTSVAGSGSSSSIYSGSFVRPISGGYRSQGIHGYNGVDLAAPVGTKIYAAAAGTVIISKSGGWNGGYGSYIVIKHGNGIQTLYAHNSQVDVVSGQRVAQGEVIGRVGNTGRSTGAHVHFEVRGAKNPF